MGNGFITRQVQSTSQIFRRQNGLFFHGEILTCHLSSFRAPPIRAQFAVSSFVPLTPVLPASFSRGTPCTTRRNLTASRCVSLGGENCHASPPHVYPSSRQSRDIMRRKFYRKRSSCRHSRPSRARGTRTGCPAAVQPAVAAVAADGSP